MGKHVSWWEAGEQELEERVLAEYSTDEVRRHLEYLTTLTRIAGTEDELKAATYIKDKLDKYGIDAEIHEFDAYISHPGKAELVILLPEQNSLPTLPHAFIASTPPEGIEAELVSVGKGSEEDYQGVEAQGKIVLIKSGGGELQVLAARIAEEKGAVAQIHITSGNPRAIEFMQLRSTWGGPTLETIDHVPKTPGISVCSEDGAYLTELARKGRVVVRLKAEAWRGYKKIRHPIGFLKGTREPEKYVLFAAHYCSWYVGATDNAAANSLLLEMARIFSNFRKHLGRSVRFAWWAGHSQGTFAGSTWYVDNFWDDIRDNAVAYLVMDGLGRIGSSGFEPRNTEEVRQFHEKAVQDALGLDVISKRVSRSGDQSFWGIGLPSFTGSTAFSENQGASGGGKKVGYGHTAEDTLDKVDMMLLKNPFRVNALSVLRLCNNPVLPFEFVTMAELFKKGMEDLQGGTPTLDLTALISAAEELKKKASLFNQTIGKNLSLLEKKETGLEGKIQKINACLMQLSRILTPVLSSQAGKYGQDPMGTRFRPIQALQPIKKLSLLDQGGEEFKALYTSLLRERNRVSDALHAATGILDDTLSII